MKLDDIRTLYDFNSWANQRTLNSCEQLTGEQFTRDLKSSFGSVRDTLVHICNAERRWLDRWHGRPPSQFAASEAPDLATLRQHWAGVERNLVDYVSSLTEADLQRVPQLTIADVQLSQPLWQYLQHVANHGSYHRGQIATMLRQLGAKADSTDLLWFYRERGSKASA